MSRALTLATLLLSLCVSLCGCGQPGGSAGRSPGARPATPSILAQPPPPVRLRPAGDALLADQVVGAPRRGGHDHLTAAEAAAEQPDQGAALQRYAGWGWLDGASRSWAGADETLVLTAVTDGAQRAFASWAGDADQAPFAQAACTPAAGAGLDACRLGVAGDRALVVGRLGTAVFRIDCPAAAAERLTEAQTAALHG